MPEHNIRLAAIVAGDEVFHPLSPDLMLLQPIVATHILKNMRDNAAYLRSADNRYIFFTLLKTGLRAFPQDLFFLHFAGQLAERHEYFQEALAFYQKGLKIHDGDKFLLTSAAVLALRMGQIDLAKEYVGRLTEIDGKDIKSLGLATRVALASGDVTAARVYIERQLALDGQDQVALGLATQVALASGDLSAARDYAEQKLALNGQDPVALGLAMQIALEERQPDRALALSELHAGATNKIITYFTAKAHLYKGEIGQVLTIVRPLIQSHPDAAFTTLYMACFDRQEEVALLQVHLVPEVFSRMWDNSRDLKSKEAALSHERDLFFGHTFWNSAVSAPVSRNEILQMAEVPGAMRRSLSEHGLS